MIVHNNLDKNYWEDPLRYWDFNNIKIWFLMIFMFTLDVIGTQ